MSSEEDDHSDNGCPSTDGKISKENQEGEESPSKTRTTMDKSVTMR